ncbi:MAG: hypothetical protein IPO27_00635 [Bacteroidetes bacterium]|nr:hypothetical protein [Bacteroidota bacterium]
MKKLLTVLFAVIVLASVTAVAQTKKKPAPKAKAPTKTGLVVNGKMSNKATAEQMIAWSELEKLEVMCDNGKKYVLKNFQINIIVKEPYAFRDFGIGEFGMPIMARKGIKEMKEGDSIYLKEIKALDENAMEVDLPVMVVGVYSETSK